MKKSGAEILWECLTREGVEVVGIEAADAA